MAFVYEHGTPRLNGSLGNARGQHVIEKTWINKTIFFWPWKWQQKRDWVICHFQKCSHGYIITYGDERRDEFCLLDEYSLLLSFYGRVSNH